MTSPSYQQNADVFFATLEPNKVQEDLLKRSLRTSTFQRTFTDELRRVHDFVQTQQQGLESSAKALFLRAHAVTTATQTSSSSSSGRESFATVHDLKRSTRKIVDDCIALQEFFTSSRHTLLDIASQHDSNNNTTSRTLVHDTMPKAHIHSSLVCVISDLYHALREAEYNIQNQNAAGNLQGLWQAPSSFQRATTKYWVKDENLTKLMMVCAAEAPLLVYGKKGPLTSTSSQTDINVSEGDKLWDTLATQITSIYFDSKDMSLYKERIARAEGAQLLRVRWYGPTMPTGNQIIFVELKTHHEKWVGNKSVKERASIQERDMLSFLEPVRWEKQQAKQMVLRAKPKLNGDELQKATGLLFRMHNLVVKHQLSACVRTRYDRAAFQSSKSNDLRLTLDRNVTVVNERMQQPTSGHWCLTDSEAQTARASVVPFNVFEVKLAGNDPMPAGLAAAMNDSTIELAPKFSKFLTGAAAFNPVPTLPYWAAHPAFYSFFELDKRWGSGSSTSADDYHLMDSSSNGETVSILPKGVVIAPKFPARVEPKTFFANERTFIQWVSASILLLSVSSFMLTAGAYFRTTAAVISFSAFCLVIYSTVLYFKRLNLLKDRRAYGYFNKANPIFLTMVVGIAVFLVWADSIKGSDFLGFETLFSSSENDDRRLLVRPARLSGRRFLQDYKKCPQDIVGTKLLMDESNPSSLVVDVKRRAFLMSLGEAVYIQPMTTKYDRSGPSKANRLIRIHQSHLQGLAIVDDQLFAVSDGPERTELIEMAWWGTRGGNEKLRVVGRWTLEKSKSQVDGFSFVPFADTTPMGSFYINMNSSISSYSAPLRSEDPESDQYLYPKRLKSLNMKVLTQGMTVGDIGSNDRLSTMVTFEGVTYILRSQQNVLEAWNLMDGAHFSEIALPATDTMMKWTGFALERRVSSSTTETQNVRGGDMLETLSADALFLHLMTHVPGSVGGQVWSFPALEDTQTPGGLFSVRECHFVTTSMN